MVNFGFNKSDQWELALTTTVLFVMVNHCVPTAKKKLTTTNHSNDQNELESDFREPRLILNLKFKYKNYPIKDEIIICIKGTSIKGSPTSEL